MDEALRRKLIDAQRSEISEQRVYMSLAAREKSPQNRRVLEQIADDERRHYEFWAGHTDSRPAPRRWTVWKSLLMARLLGLTFAIKLMEKGEERAEQSYGEVVRSVFGADM